MPKDFAAFCRKPTAAVSSGLALALLLVGFFSVSADARERHHRRGHAVAPTSTPDHRSSARRSAAPRPQQAVVPGSIAAIVVDVNSGRTLYAKDEDKLRHPASITKVMTLYLLFEQIESGRLRLDSAIPISPHAAAQAPTKLGLRPGATIPVEDAIKAVVTRSANDIAVAIAEAIGGDEESFAAMMTRKAHALGMTRTHFANASGLPDDSQVTTAYDLSLLGRAVQDHFPRYYRYFATRTFTYRGAAIRNHNHLLERVDGMDGIKTGYTRASGFNLLAAVKRNGRHIVAVVLGGRSAGHRDRIMADLIEDKIEGGSSIRTAGAIPLPRVGGSPTTVAARAAVVPAAVPAASGRVVAQLPDPKLPFVPVTLKPGLTVDTAPVRAIGVTAPSDRPRPAYVAAVPRPRPDGAAPVPAEKIPLRVALDGSTRAPAIVVAAATATPSTLPRPRALVPPEPLADDRSASAGRPADRGGSVDPGRSSEIRGGWMIQIGATEDLGKATDLLARAKQEGARALGGARPTTEKIQKGSVTLYRARFVGLEAASAASACKTLKQSGFACFAARN